ncbi:MAG: hypothetical protein E6G32_06320 [Actinobacteria bacterium]|nr:MAG: hypothetical protein E6G32_06320 [Actinomycetota bacterium]
MPGAAITDATSVPWSSSSKNVVCWFSSVVFGRDANSPCVMSSPESTIVTGLPGPGGVAASAPIAVRHHSLSAAAGTSTAVVVRASRRSRSARTTMPARRSLANARSGTRHR